MNEFFPLRKEIAVAREVAAEFRRSHPHWVGCDSPLKYVDWALPETLVKCDLLLEALSPPIGSRVFEFGPGAGYLLYQLRTRYRCEVAGCDIAERPLYKAVQSRLGIAGVVDEPVVARKLVASLRGPYDYLIATQVSWMDAWDQGDLDFFLTDCRCHLAPYGSLVLFLNPKACRGVPIDELFAGHHATPLRLPWLGDGRIL